MTSPQRRTRDVRLPLLVWGPEPSLTIATIRQASTASALVITRYLALGDSTVGKTGREHAINQISRWAVANHLGATQVAVQARAARRARIVSKMSSAAAPGTMHVETTTVLTEGRLVLGLGDRRASHDLSIVMDGTYGHPYLPGSGVKGVTAAWARSTRQEATLREQVFGRAPTSKEDDGTRGRVVFHDALLHGQPHIITDVLTPHPEGANPNPVRFLALSNTRFTLMLTGPAGLTQQAMTWLIAALDTLGFGAKTAAGYGYLVKD